MHCAHLQAASYRAPWALAQLKVWRWQDVMARWTNLCRAASFIRAIMKCALLKVGQWVDGTRHGTGCRCPRCKAAGNKGFYVCEVSCELVRFAFQTLDRERDRERLAWLTLLDFFWFNKSPGQSITCTAYSEALLGPTVPATRVSSRLETLRACGLTFSHSSGSRATALKALLCAHMQALVLCTCRAWQEVLTRWILVCRRLSLTVQSGHSTLAVRHGQGRRLQRWPLAWFASSAARAKGCKIAVAMNP